MRKKGIIIALTVGVIGILAAIGVLYAGYKLMIEDKYDYRVDTYNDMASENHLMPTTDEIGDYSAVFTQYCINNYFPFRSDSYTLTAKYNENDYVLQKDRILKKYTFQSSDIAGDVNNIIKPDFDLDGFQFHTLSLSLSKADFPKELYFIGFNDATSEIAYIYFYDPDIDVISAQFDRFIRNDCGWNYQKVKYDK